MTFALIFSSLTACIPEEYTKCVGGTHVLQITAIRRLVCDSPCTMARSASQQPLHNEPEVQGRMHETTRFSLGFASSVVSARFIFFPTTGLRCRALPPCEQMAFAVGAALLLLACRSAADPASGPASANQSASISGARTCFCADDSWEAVHAQASPGDPSCSTSCVTSTVPCQQPRKRARRAARSD